MSDQHLLGINSLDAAIMIRNECSSANLLTNVKHISYFKFESKEVSYPG